MNKRKNSTVVKISIGVEVFRLVWVKAYRRLRFGKIERVKGHYRDLALCPNTDTLLYPLF